MQVHVELDRLAAAAEDNFQVGLLQVIKPELTTKAEMLVGVPASFQAGSTAWLQALTARVWGVAELQV